MNIDSKIRTVERATGATIRVVGGIAFVYDPETGENFAKELGSPSRQVLNVKALHEDIYHAKARKKHEMQGGRCAACGRQLGNRGECDHIKPRSRGRDDRLPNIQIVCVSMDPAGCNFHGSKHGQGESKT